MSDVTVDAAQAFLAEYWRAEYYKAKADNVALHKGVRRLKKVEKELRERLLAKEHELSGGPFKCESPNG